ncbi:S41 family peptidase [Mucilaginibacter sp. SP1R1]|uniref:S41 family peptidase n=1 Tax=Mucilaginibacter sp. SP1R1 TaxID=2723091 RepID=UPI001620AF6C|nr:S41 family peptidase [Mucilaginibacter sp. SP1R1]MBB6150036.1 C-terminal processing protease CtpA/Prc [Mucilaginibacter sp. SP1R1]
MKQKLLILITIFFTTSATICLGQNSGGGKELKNNMQNAKAEISNYNTACYFALEGDKDLAFTYLKQAVYHDHFSNVNDIENDSDLKSLHNAPLWNTLIKAIQENLTIKNKSSRSFVNNPVFFNTNALITPYRENISDDEKIAGLSKLWSEVKYNFVNFDLVPHLNFDSLYLAYIPRVKQTVSTLSYYKIMIEFCAQLKDGHTNVYAPDELDDEFYARPLLRSRMIEGKVLIVGVFDSVLEKQGIKPGMEIITVNGLAVKEYATKYIMPYQSSSTQQDMETRLYEYSLLGGSLKEPIKLELLDALGHKKAYTIYRVKPEERSKRLAVSPFEFKILKGNIAYIAMNSFVTDTATRAFSSNFKEISNANAIIIDVRNNGGGSTPYKILSFLIEKELPIQSWWARDYQPYERAAKHNQNFLRGVSILNSVGKSYYSKPVVMLTSSRTYSAAEDLVAAFKSLKRGIIIGTATGGSTGQPVVIGLPGDGSARICTIRDMLADGEDFVGKGIQPDKLVAPTAEDIRKGVDAELEAALRYLSAK